MGVRPQAVEPVLRELSTSACFIRRDIYNARPTERLSQLGGHYPVEHLVERLQNEGSWRHAIQSADLRHIRFLMFAHQKSITYANRYGTIRYFFWTVHTRPIDIECLYFTLWAFRQPTNHSRSRFASMENEEAESYRWVLEHLLLIYGAQKW